MIETSIGAAQAKEPESSHQTHRLTDFENRAYVKEINMGQRTTCGGRLSPSTVWVPGVELRFSDLVAFYDRAIVLALNSLQSINRISVSKT